MIEKITKELQNGLRNYSIVCVIIGILFLVWPGATVTVMIQVSGVLLIIAAIVDLIAAFRNRKNMMIGAVVAPALISLILGIWFLLAPGFVLTVVPVIIGLVCLFYGIWTIVLQVMARAAGLTTIMAGAVIAVILGILLLANPWSGMKFLLRILGVIMIFIGANGLNDYSRRKKMFKDQKDERDGNIIDVDYKEDDR